MTAPEKTDAAPAGWQRSSTSPARTVIDTESYHIVRNCDIFRAL